MKQGPDSDLARLEGSLGLRGGDATGEGGRRPLALADDLRDFIVWNWSRAPLPAVRARTLAPAPYVLMQIHLAK